MALHRTKRHGVRGTAAIEFALIIPFLLIILVGLTEVGLFAYQGMQVQNAVEAGAIYVAKKGWNAAGISSAVMNASGTEGITASPAPTQFCGCPSAAGIVAATCGVTCASGGTTGTYVKINATLAHETILTYPGLTVPTSLSAQVIVRIN
jgi:Flp pilus assembly protein TadG